MISPINGTYCLLPESRESFESTGNVQENRMDIKFFDNYEDDGQLSMFGVGEQEEESAELESDTAIGTGIRIMSCSSCGKLLFVREESDAFFAECNNCGIRYCQKK